LELSYNNHPEINIAEIDIQRAESRIRLNDSKYLPQLYVGIDGGFYSPGYNFKKDINPNYTAFATVSVPISTWGKRSYETKALKFQMESSKEQLNKVKDKISLEVQTAQQNLLKAVQQVELTKQSLEKAKENERKSLERYEDGKNSIVEVIDAQTYRQTAQYNFVEAKAMTQTAYSALIKALNKY
jgi:outer membrane protein TolC